MINSYASSVVTVNTLSGIFPEVFSLQPRQCGGLVVSSGSHLGVHGQEELSSIPPIRAHPHHAAFPRGFAYNPSMRYGLPSLMASFLEKRNPRATRKSTIRAACWGALGFFAFAFAYLSYLFLTQMPMPPGFFAGFLPPSWFG
jgi:hypothetical protein